MKKTLDDYMNDPDIINENPVMREIHAIRLMIYDRTKHMTNAEFNEHYKKIHDDFIKNQSEEK